MKKNSYKALPKLRRRWETSLTALPHSAYVPDLLFLLLLLLLSFFFFFFFFFSSSFFFFYWHYSALWALACRTCPSVFSYLPPILSIFSLPALEDLSTSSFRLFLGIPLLLVPSRSSVKIFLGILSSSLLSR